MRPLLAKNFDDAGEGLAMEIENRSDDLEDLLSTKKSQDTQRGLRPQSREGVKEILTTDFADCTDKHTVTHPSDPYY